MKLMIDILDEEYKTLSELSEKEKVNELSYFEKIIANGIPYEERPTSYWVDDEHGTTCHHCGSLSHRWSKFCPDCGAQMQKGGAEQ